MKLLITDIPVYHRYNQPQTTLGLHHLLLISFPLRVEDSEFARAQSSLPTAQYIPVLEHHKHIYHNSTTLVLWPTLRAAAGKHQLFCKPSIRQTFAVNCEAYTMSDHMTQVTGHVTSQCPNTT